MKYLRYFGLLLPIIAIAIHSKSQNNLNIDLIYHWADTSLIGSNAFNNTYNEVWGFVEDGIEYGVIGTTAGTHIFDLSDPQNAYEAVFIPGEVQGGQVIHRDYHDFDGYLYIVCDEGPSTFRIADLSFLPDSAPLVYDSNQFFSRSHNIFIDENAKKLYACGTHIPGKTLMVFDISNPESPTEIGHLNFSQSVHDIFVRNDTAYINVGNIGLHIYDFSDAANPNLLGQLTNYPYQGYNHSGWLSDDGNTYVLADETWGAHVKIIDVSDLTNISVLSTVFSNIDTNLSIAHNVMLRGNYLFVSHYYDGLYVYDITDRSNPSLYGHYQTSNLPHIQSYEGAWGVHSLLPSGLTLVSDMQEGFFILDVQNVTSTKLELDASLQELFVWPNPFNNIINIKNGLDYDRLRVLNVKGQEIINIKGKSQIELPIFTESGAYFIEASKGDAVEKAIIIK